MRIAILRRSPKASVSMDVYADRLVAGLRRVRPGWVITEYHPQNPTPQAESARGWVGIQKYYERYWRFPRHLRQVEADIFHIIDQGDGYLCRWLRRSHRPNVVTCHDIINLIKPETFKGRARFPLISMAAWRWGVEGMQQANHIVTVSTQTKQDVEIYLHIPPMQMTVVPNGVDAVFQPLPLAARQAARDRYRLAPKTFCLLNVGSNNQRKNVAGILAALAQLKPQGLPLHFWKAGVDFTPEQQAFIAAHDLTEMVTFLGQPDQGELIQLYNAADCLLAPSFYEGFGLTLLEAMACGTPVITGNVSAMPEVVGEAAILVNPEDPAAIATAIHHLSTHPAERQSLSQKGLDRAQQFTWENTAEQIALLYEQILSDIGANPPSSAHRPLGMTAAQPTPY